MTERSWPEMSARLVCVHPSSWTNGKGLYATQKRFDIIEALSNTTTRNEDSLGHLRTIVQSGWDVNELLVMQHDYGLQEYLVKTTALHEAARRGWTEGVQVLLKAGAECKTSNGLKNPLTVALQNPCCPPDLIELLLEHGADPNDYGHFGYCGDRLGEKFESVPLLNAIANCRYNHSNTRIVILLLEHGADPNVVAPLHYEYNISLESPLSEALNQPFNVFAVLFKALIQFGADMNYMKLQSSGHGMRAPPLLHGMMTKEHASSAGHIPLQEQLDLFFLHGGHIDQQDQQHRTVLENVLRKSGNSNSVRWLIRHGADTSQMQIILLRHHFITYGPRSFFPETPLILLQAGMSVSHGAYTELNNIETAISNWLQAWTMDSKDLLTEIKGMWAKLVTAEEGEPQKTKRNTRNFPEYWSQQMADLQEFSDESLQCYPENTEVLHVNSHNRADRMQKQWKTILDQIHTMLVFLSQPQSLQWHCRKCLRWSLVSLQPSVVKTLSIPSRLKRYILCHEI